MSFTTATAVTRTGPGTWSGQIEPGWDIFDIANGGYLMAITARAMANETIGRDLVSISAHFLNPGRAGPVSVEVETLKVGRRISTLRAGLIGLDKPVLSALASFADPERAVSPAKLIQSPPPEIPPPNECVRAEHSPERPFPPPFVNKVQLMLHPQDASALQGDRTGIARLRGWMRLLDGEPADPIALVLAADSFPPAVFNTTLPVNWTPTLDLTVHVRDPRPRTWLQLDVRTRFVTGGLLEEDVDVWDEEGSLVAHSRQLALVPR